MIVKEFTIGYKTFFRNVMRKKDHFGEIFSVDPHKVCSVCHLPDGTFFKKSIDILFVVWYNESKANESKKNKMKILVIQRGKREQQDEKR